jgi:hypothetical protein
MDDLAGGMFRILEFPVTIACDGSKFKMEVAYCALSYTFHRSKEGNGHD